MARSDNRSMVERFHISDIDPDVLDLERKRILDLLKAHITPEWVHEVGSTAVPGVVGKQDLDFLVLVPATDFLRTSTDLDRLFQRNAEQLSTNTYQGYRVDSDLDVAIQLTVEDGPYDTFLVFLDRLRDSESLRSDYNQLKQAFEGRPMNAYRDAKRLFIERVVADRHQR